MSIKLIARNKRAYFDYEILEKIEAGIILHGTEVKALRLGRVSLNESFIGETSEFPGQLFLFNLNIDKYAQAKHFNHDPKRPRGLLMHSKETHRALQGIRKKSMTMIPLSIYFNSRGFVKIEVALAKGKTTVDKRKTIQERDWNREKARVLKAYS